MTEPAILTDRQKAFLSLFAKEEDLVQTFVLTGGTALAEEYLHHRLSEDLDFFTQDRVDILRIHRFIDDAVKHLDASDVTSQRLYDRNIFILQCGKEELKVEFTQYPFTPLSAGPLRDGIRIASLRDIAAGKLFAIFDRFEPKDFYDLYFLLQEGHTTLDALRKDLQTKYHEKADPLFLGSLLARGANLPSLPQMLKQIEKTDVQKFFVQLALELRGEVLED